MASIVVSLSLSLSRQRASRALCRACVIHMYASKRFGQGIRVFSKEGVAGHDASSNRKTSESPSPLSRMTRQIQFPGRRVACRNRRASLGSRMPALILPSPPRHHSTRCYYQTRSGATRVSAGCRRGIAIKGGRSMVPATAIVQRLLRHAPRHRECMANRQERLAG